MTTDRPARWKRFSLRSLFIVTTVCCLVFGTWAAYVNPYRLQLRSLAEVNRLQGNSAKSPAEGPGWHRWLVTTLLGDDAFVHVTEVDLTGKKVDDAALRSLAGLVHLQELLLDYTRVSDKGIDALRSMPALQRLSLRYTNVSDRAAEHLATLPNLETVYLTGTKLTDAAVDNLSKNSALTELYIRWTRITNPAAARLAAALPNCAVHHHALADEPRP